MDDYRTVEFPDGKGYERHGSPTFYKLLDEMANTHSEKSHDYASNENPFGNYEFAGQVSSMFAHSPSDAGFAGRLAEKIYRLANLESSGKTPKNESIGDTERDIAVITTLWMANRRDRREKNKVIKEDNDLELYVIKNEHQYDILMLERVVGYLQAVIDSRNRNANTSRTTGPTRS